MMKLIQMMKKSNSRYGMKKFLFFWEAKKIVESTFGDGGIKKLFESTIDDVGLADSKDKQLVSRETKIYSCLTID